MWTDQLLLKLIVLNQYFKTNNSKIFRLCIGCKFVILFSLAFTQVKNILPELNASEVEELFTRRAGSSAVEESCAKLSELLNSSSCVMRSEALGVTAQDRGTKNESGLKVCGGVRVLSSLDLIGLKN